VVRPTDFSSVAVVARAIRAGDADAARKFPAGNLDGVFYNDASALGASAPMPVVRSEESVTTVVNCCEIRLSGLPDILK
jgi:hypothetical protein